MRVFVENLTSNNGNKVANQFVIYITDDQGIQTETFQSYETVIAQKSQGQIILDQNALEYSNTTLKYLKIFLNTDASKKELYKAIESGKYTVTDLNP